MALGPQKIAILGLSITSSWGNGHATTYRSLVRELSGRGHEVLFLEKDVPWYRENRDLAKPPWCRTGLYSNMEELKDCYEAELREADFVIIGSYVPQGVQVAEWALNAARGATAFYDIDTPVTLAKLCRRDYEYLTPELISRFDLYLSFTGGPILAKIERDYGSPMARPLYPDTIAWPANTERIDHLPPGQHASFYGSMAFTMNITRADMVRAGYSPSVRLFEAAACATPVISDYWVGLETFFRPGVEILISGSAEETIRYLRETPEEERLKMGERARARVLAGHTAFHRVDELESYMGRVLKKQEVLK